MRMRMRMRVWVVVVVLGVLVGLVVPGLVLMMGHLVERTKGKVGWK